MIPELSLLFVMFLLGLRHGVDWDHIAAISDVTGATNDRKRAFYVGLAYALGHASVIIILGICAVLLGINLPTWVDAIMQPLVGMTLILLGLYVLISIIRSGENFQLKSRWMLVFSYIKQIKSRIHARMHNEDIIHSVLHHPEEYSLPTAFSVGAIHGIGAETPSQVVLFVTAAGASGNIGGIAYLLIFVVGLVISNSAITLLSIYGFVKARQSKKIYIALGFITAIFSIIIGSMYLFGMELLFPVLF